MKLHFCLLNLALVSAFTPVHQLQTAVRQSTSTQTLFLAADAADDTDKSDDTSDSPPEETVKEEIKSAAAEWAKKQEEARSQALEKKKKFAVVGGGWGGWGAAKALCEADDVEVTLLDALPDPTGATPFLSKTGKPGTLLRNWRSFERSILT